MHEFCEGEIGLVQFVFQKMQYQSGHHHQIARSGLEKKKNRQCYEQDYFLQSGVNIYVSFYTGSSKMFLYYSVLSTGAGSWPETRYATKTIVRNATTMDAKEATT